VLADGQNYAFNILLISLVVVLVLHCGIVFINYYLFAFIGCCRTYAQRVSADIA